MTGAALGDAGSRRVLSQADATIAALRPKFRACYNAALRVDPSVDGRVIIEAVADGDGAVIRTSVASQVGLSDKLTACLKDVVSAARFEPSGGPALLNVPITFKQNHAEAGAP